MANTKTWVFGFALLACSLWKDGVSQSLIGTTGLVTIPAGELIGDREVYFGTAAGNKRYNSWMPGEYHHYSYFATIGFLPFLEVSLRLMRSYQYSRGVGLGDRTVSVRFRALQEKKHTPALVIGVHDVLSSVDDPSVIFNNALYVVCSKNITLGKGFSKIGLHLGYGTNRMKAARHQFVGLFGGVSVDVNRMLTLMIEHDAEKFNCGAAFHFFRHIQIQAALMHFDSFAAGLSYAFRI
jgi:hypothetical protein